MRTIAIIFLLIGSISASLTVETPKDTLSRCLNRCKNVVTRYKSTDPSSPCFEYNSVRPYPQLFTACDDTYKKGADYGCKYGCGALDLNEESGIAKGICFGIGRSQQFTQLVDDSICRDYNIMMPRPTVGNLCKSSFTRGVDAECSKSALWMSNELAQVTEQKKRIAALEESKAFEQKQKELQQIRDRERAAKVEEERIKAELEEIARLEEQLRLSQKRGRVRGLG